MKPYPPVSGLTRPGRREILVWDCCGTTGFAIPWAHWKARLGKDQYPIMPTAHDDYPYIYLYSLKGQSESFLKRHENFDLRSLPNCYAAIDIDTLRKDGRLDWDYVADALTAVYVKTHTEDGKHCFTLVSPMSQPPETLTASGPQPETPESVYPDLLSAFPLETDDPKLLPGVYWGECVPLDQINGVPVPHPRIFILTERDLDNPHSKRQWSCADFQDYIQYPRDFNLIQYLGTGLQ